MPILHALGDFLTWLGWYIVPFLLIMNGIVFFHELGHYLVGRWCGVKIEAFSLGFGPELLARVDSQGTRWRLALFPLGGYVKFLGDANAASGQDGATLAAVDPADARRTLAAQPVLESRRDRRGGAGRQFHPGDGAVHRAVPGLRPVRATTRASASSSRTRRRRGRVSRPATSSSPSTASRSARFQDLQQAAVLNTGLDMTFVVDRGGADADLARGAAGDAGRPGRARQAADRPSRPRIDARSQGRHVRALRRRAMRRLGGRAGRVHHPRDASPISAACSPGANRSIRCRAWSP